MTFETENAGIRPRKKKPLGEPLRANGERPRPPRAVTPSRELSLELFRDGALPRRSVFGRKERRGPPLRGEGRGLINPRRTKLRERAGGEPVEVLWK